MEWSQLTIFIADVALIDFKNFYILMLGRLLGGVATSLLFSVFDAWLIRAHNDAQVKQFLGKSFSYAAYGNSIIAILAGLVANKSTTIMKMTALTNVFYFGGCLFPFDVAMIALLTAGFLALTTWEENYGEQEDSDNRTNHWYDGLKNAFTSTIRSTDVLLCGIVSSLFEGSMYVSTTSSHRISISFVLQSVAQIHSTFCLDFCVYVDPGSLCWLRATAALWFDIQYVLMFKLLSITLNPVSQYRCAFQAPLWFAVWRAPVFTISTAIISKTNS